MFKSEGFIPLPERFWPKDELLEQKQYEKKLKQQKLQKKLKKKLQKEKKILKK